MIMNNKINLVLSSVYALTLAFGFNVKAQTILKKQDVSGIKNTKIDNFNFYTLAKQKPVYNFNQGENDRAVTKTVFTSSRNMYTLLVTESNCLTANQDLNTIMFTHRISNFYNVPNDNSGFVQSTFSNNYGQTWDSILVMSDEVNLCRYPSGAIFNPAGNTNLGNAFVTVSGPITTGTGWVGNYFTSAKLDHTNLNPNIALNANVGVANQSYARIGATATDLKTVVTGGIYTDPNATTPLLQGYKGVTLNYATPAANNTFNWTVDSIKPNFVTDFSGENEVYTVTQTAWNKAGDIGYVVFDGVDAFISGFPRSYMPIVYKTTDAGTTWTQLPPFNFSGIPIIADKLLNTTSGGAPKAWFTQNKGFDVAVDANGQLHVFCTVLSAFSNHPDSLGYTRSYATNAPSKTFYMYDSYTTSNGTWDAVLVDSLMTDNSQDFSPFTDEFAASIEIDARLQMSRTDNGSKLFFFWLDSDPNINNQVENNQPNIFGKAFDVNTGQWTVTKQFTSDNTNYYMYVSNLAIQSGNTYKVPVTVSLPIGWPNNVSTIDPVKHYFVNGIEFDQSEFTVTKNHSNSNVDFFEIGTISPNPATNFIDIKINDPKNNHVVQIFGMDGALQKEVVVDKTDRIQLDNMANGVYLLKLLDVNNSTQPQFYKLIINH